MIDAALIAKVCDIIKSAHKHNVQRLRLGELEIDFREKADHHAPILMPEIRHTQPSELDLTKVLAPTSEDMAANLEQLMIEDPAGYEKYLQDLALEAEEN